MTISVNPIFTSISLRKIAFFCSSKLGDDIYYLKEFIDIMINVYGEDLLIDMLKKDQSNNKKILNKIGNDWDKSNGMRNNLKKFDKLIEITKSAYDTLDDKTLKKTDSPSYKTFLEKSKRIPAIKDDFYALFVFLVNNSSINRMSIPQEYFKILEHRFNRAVGEMEKRRIGDMPSERREMP